MEWVGQFESFVGVNPWTALFVLLNTLTIFFVGRKYLFGPVTKIIEDRQKEIDDM
jgi:F-type H+-transporting ATPase subunit b